MKHLALLGSSGSIGSQTKDVVRANPERFALAGLCVHSNLESLYRDIAEFRPKIVGVTSERAAKEFDRARLCGAKFIAGQAAAEEVAGSCFADTAVLAVSGMCGLKSLIAAIKTGKRVCLANKESLVTGGEIVTALSAKHGNPIFPVDSEHSAIFQCLAAGRREDVCRIILTASGGPFRGRTRAELETVTVEQALRHPTWRMGPKITVDSATLMNKGLEIIEARWLFDSKNIDVVLQPTSVVHSMVEFLDGSVIAQMGTPGMELPIALALTTPERLRLATPKLNFDALRAIPFEPVDEETFPCLRLARESMHRGGYAPTVLNAANEIAVTLFLEGRIGFLDIPCIVEKALADWDCRDAITVDGIYTLDAEVKRKIQLTINN